ncbi:MAG: type IV pilus assembly protein PilM [Planctomycetes bacterium]|nr:type IV pilus assembly protein PilM [Planctomycetota bacterium]
MATNQAIWGIDMGRCALKAVKLRVGAEGNLELVGQDFIEHPKILSQPDADRHELISNALEKFLSRNDLSKDLVVVSVPGQHTLSRFTKLPPVAPKRIPDIVRYEADQQIPFDMDEVIWDYQTFQQEGTPDIEVGIFAMKRELIRDHLLHFEQASIEPIIVQSGPLAVYNTAHYEGLLETDTTVLLDIGAENTDLIIATQNSLWTRTIPIGGNSLTEALVKSFKLSFSKAESLKRTAATNKYTRQIFQAMRPIFADLVQELQRSIGFYSSTHRDASIEKVIAVGNALLLPGLQKYLQQNLGITVERPESFKKAVSAGQAAQGILQEQHLSLYTAYGLALQGLDRAKITSNLLPSEIAKQALWRKKRPPFAAAAACLLLAGGLIWFRQVSDMKALASSIDNVAPPANAASLINNGPPASDPDWVKAKKILDAGQDLKKQLRELAGQGQAEQDVTAELILLQQNKTVIPALLSVIHKAVPTPPGALGKAETPAQVLAAVQSGTAPPRGQRQQVLIQAMGMQFEQDLKLFDWTSLVEIPEPFNDYDIDTAGEVPGLRIALTFRTPNQGGAAFIRDGFMTALRQAGRRPDTGFYFDQVSLISGEKVGSASRPGAMGRSSSGRSGRGSGVSSKSGLNPALPPESVDPLTFEPIVDDWEFEVWISVIFEDYPGDEDEG